MAVVLISAKNRSAPTIENAIAPIWKLLCVAEKTFRRLTAAHLLAAVAAGAQYADGKPVRASAERNAA